MLANPPTNVSTVNAATLRDPNHRVKAANAVAYSTAPIARPAAIHAAAKQPMFGAVASPTSDADASTDPPSLPTGVRVDQATCPRRSRTAPR